MKILEDLWDGKIAPNHRRSTSEETFLTGMILKNQEKLTSMLTPEAKELLDKLTDCQGELSSLSDCKIFIEGFRMGARVMMEVLNET